MAQFLHQPLVQFVLWLAALGVLIALGVYAVGRVRSLLNNQQASNSDLMSDFREIYSQGDLSDEEYRAIKGTLAERLQSELKKGDKNASGDRREGMSPGESLPSLRIASLKQANLSAGPRQVDGVSDNSSRPLETSADRDAPAGMLLRDGGHSSDTLESSNRGSRQLPNGSGGLGN